MYLPLLVTSSLLVAALTLALVREVRLRRALQCLLQKLISFWRVKHEEPLEGTPSDTNDDTDGDAA